MFFFRKLGPKQSIQLFAVCYLEQNETLVLIESDCALHSVFAGVLQNHKWEDAMTVDKKSWGYRRNTSLSDFLTMDDLTYILASVVR